jgi:hypothetical protein
LGAPRASSAWAPSAAYPGHCRLAVQGSAGRLSRGSPACQPSIQGQRRQPAARPGHHYLAVDRPSRLPRWLRVLLSLRGIFRETTLFFSSPWIFPIQGAATSFSSLKFLYWFPHTGNPPHSHLVHRDISQFFDGDAKLLP